MHVTIEEATRRMLRTNPHHHIHHQIDLDDVKAENRALPPPCLRRKIELVVHLHNNNNNEDDHEKKEEKGKIIENDSKTARLRRETRLRLRSWRSERKERELCAEMCTRILTDNLMMAIIVMIIMIETDSKIGVLFCYIFVM